MIERWGRLAAYELDRETLRAVLGLDCEACPGGAECRDRAKGHPMLKSGGWKVCPEEARMLPHWQLAIRLFNASQVGPLAGWPHEWTPWVVDSLGALRAALEEKKVKAMKAGGKGGPSKPRI